MSNEPEIPEIDMSKRIGESATDVPEWDDAVIEFESSTGIYSVNGQPILRCQTVELHSE